MSEELRLLRNAKRLANDLLSAGEWYESDFEIDTHTADSEGEFYSGESFERRARLLSKQIKEYLDGVK